jgi:hypothetical protein
MSKIYNLQDEDIVAYAPKCEELARLYFADPDVIECFKALPYPAESYIEAMAGFIQMAAEQYLWPYMYAWKEAGGDPAKIRECLGAAFALMYPEDPRHLNKEPVQESVH